MTNDLTCTDCGAVYPSTRAAMLCCAEEYRGDRYTEENR